jgi:hypothetical protein
MDNVQNYFYIKLHYVYSMIAFRHVLQERISLKAMPIKMKLGLNDK